MKSKLMPEIVPLYNWDSPEFLFSGVNHQMALSSFDKQLLSQCRGRLDVQTISQKLSKDIDTVTSRLQYFKEKGVLVEIPKASHHEGTGTILVVEPHSDDAYLSVGGMLLCLRKTIHQIYILNVFSIAEHVHRRARHFVSKCMKNNACQQEIHIQIRQKEAEMFGKYIGADYHFLNFEDAALREMNARDDVATRQWIVETLKQNLDHFNQLRPSLDYILCPMGLGDHPDHGIVFDCIVDWAKESKELHRIVFYEDMPYVIYIDQLETTITERLSNRDLTFRPICFDIGKVMEEKISVGAIFRSQVPLRRQFLCEYAQQMGMRRFQEKRGKTNQSEFCERLWIDSNSKFPRSL
jgi:LmbE family N-acetylglucosaminyl deacetylase